MRQIHFLFILLALIADFSAVFLVTEGGWEILILGLPFLGVWIGHAIVHGFYSLQITRWTAASVIIFICSDLILVGVFLAQPAINESSGLNWVRVSKLLIHSNYVPQWYSLQLGLFSFVLVFASWVCIWLVSHPHRDWFPATAMAINVISCLAIGGLLMAVVHYEQARETAEIEKFGGLPPSNCKAGPIPVMPAGNPLKDSYFTYVGTFPVWWNGPKIENGQAVIHMRNWLDERYLEAFQMEERDPQGRFIVRTKWIVEGIEEIPVQIRVTAEPSGELMPVEITGAGPKREDGLLDPADAKAIFYYDPPQHREFYGEFLVPGPGCYAMEANWPGGSWRIPFALGW